MDETPISETDKGTLRFLRRLVTALTLTMIFGLLTIVTLLVIRFSSDEGKQSNTSLDLPQSIELPQGATPTAFTMGSDWIAIVTDDDRILIFDRMSHELRQIIGITPK